MHPYNTQPNSSNQHQLPLHHNNLNHSFSSSYSNRQLHNENYLTPSPSSERLNLLHSRQLHCSKANHSKKNSQSFNPIHSLSHNQTIKNFHSSSQTILLSLLSQIQKMETKLKRLEHLEEKVNKIESLINDSNFPICQQIKLKIEEIQKQLKKKDSSDEAKIIGQKIKSATKVFNQYKEPVEKLEAYVKLQNQQNQARFQSLLETAKVQITKEFQKVQKKELSFFKSNRKYSSNPITFTYEEYIKASQNAKQPVAQININKIIYYIDKEGYLLDNNNIYLVTGDGHPIQLSEKQLKMLRKIKILEE